MIEAVADRYVYAINDEHGKPCYIGVGSGRRLRKHVQKAQIGKPVKSGKEKHEYFIDCLRRGYTPVAYKVAEDLSADEAFAYEKTLIAWYGRRDLGTGNLFNLREGGGGGKNPGKETRAKMSARAIERMKNPEARIAAGNSMRGKKHTPEWHILVSIKQKARWTQEERARQARIMKVRGFSDKTRAKISAKTTEQMASTAARTNLREKAIKRMSNPAARALLSAKVREEWASREGRARKIAGMKKQKRNRPKKEL